jgi:ABC-type transporter Mla subunit MlaD
LSVNRRRALGLLVLVGLALIALALWQRPDPFASPQVIRADVADASGLAAIGADVRVAGVPVGKVTGVARAGNVARLTLTLDSATGIIHRDATLALRPRLLFEGTAYVALAPGSPNAPPLDGRVIPVTQTSTYVPLDDVLSVLEPRTRNNVRRLAATAGGLLSRRAPEQLNRVIAAGPGLSSDLAVIAAAARGPHASELHSAVGSLGRMASAVASRAPALTASLGEANRTFAALQTQGGRALGETLAALPASMTNLRQGAGAASSIVDALGRLIPRLEPGVRGLNPTITAVEPLLSQAVPVARALDPLLAQVQTAVADAAPAAGPTLAGLKALSPTVHIFQNTLLPALQERTDLGDPAYLAFLGLFAGGGGASRPFGVDGQGHFMRFGLRFLTGAGQPLPPCSLVNKVSPTFGKMLAKYGGCTP